MKGGRQPFEFLTHLDHEGVPYADDQEQEAEEQHQHQPRRSPNKHTPPPHRQSSFEQHDQQPAHKEEATVPVELNNNDSEGVFAMTGLGEEEAVREKPRARPTSTLRSKHFATVSLSSLPHALEHSILV